MGVCTVKDNEIVFERETGKLQPRLVSAALKLSGIKSVVKFNGEEDEAETENEQEDAPSVEPPKPNGPAAKTVPVENKAPQQNVPKPPVTAPSGQVSPLAKDFQEKLKKLRPAFDDALKKAKAQTKGTWADDLDSNFAQMVQEAKAGQFDKALATLARLARMVKSEEAARAEVKHQSMKEDEVYAQATSDRMDKHYAKDEVKQIRKGSKDKGFGLTEDGNVSYALPVKPAEWKSKVVGGLDQVMGLLKEEQVDIFELGNLTGDISDMINRVAAHADESDGQFPERAKAIYAMQELLSAYQEEFGKISATLSSNKSPAELADACSELRKQIQTLLGNARKAMPDKKAIEDFTMLASKRAQEREAALRKRGVSMKELEKEVDKLRVQLKEFGPEPEDERQELERELDEKIETLTIGTDLLRRDISDHSSGTTEKQEMEQFQKGERQPDNVMLISRRIDLAKSLIEKRQFDQARQAISDLASELINKGFAEEDAKEQEAYQALQFLESELMIAAQAKAGSPSKAARLAKRVKNQAEKFAPLLA